MNQQIEHAIEQFRNQAGRYRRTKRYYSGEHNLNFATEKFANTFGDLFREFALNLCPAVVDAMRDKLKITGFGIDSVRSGSARSPIAAADKNAVDSSLSSEIDAIWRRNRMAVRSGEVHKEVLRCGDAYLIVWPGEDSRVRIFPNSAETCVLQYDDEEPGRILWAAKYWRGADKRTRLNLFFPDRIEKYVSKNEHDAFLPDAKSFTPLGSKFSVQESTVFQPSPFREMSGGTVQPPAGAGGTDSGVVENPYGVVPVFHFANNADIGSFGISELESAMPVQDGLNKAVLDMLVAMEVCAFRQRWVAGIEVKLSESTGEPVAPFTTGIDTVWQSENPDARFGDFAASDLEQFLKVKDGFRIDIASVTGTPLYYLMPQMGGFPSGESLRKAETRFLAKVRDRQEQFGSVWADAMSFALKVAGHRDVSLITNWEDASPVSEREMLENLLLKKELGISVEQALREAGYGDIDVQRMTR